MENQKKRRMRTIDIKQFSENLKRDATQAIPRQAPLKVRQGKGKYFVVLSADEWEREQETLHVLQDTDLMRQIATSLKAHTRKATKRKISANHRRGENEGAGI